MTLLRLFLLMFVNSKIDMQLSYKVNYDHCALMMHMMQLKQALFSQQFGQHSSALVRTVTSYLNGSNPDLVAFLCPPHPTDCEHISLCGELGRDPNSLS